MGRPLDEDIIIKILERWQKAFKENSHYVSASDLSLVIKDVRELPTIQSVATDTNVGDTISRQAAIDLVTDMEFMNFTAKGILRDSLRKLSPAQPELNLENLVRMIEFGITATNSRDAYSLGMRNGMRWCKSLIDGAEPKFEDVTDSAELLSTQPEPQEGHWIKHETPDGGEQYECSLCGVLWEFNDGTPEDNEAYFCPKCGAKMTISK